MEFKAQKKETIVLNPLKEMARRSIPSEIREDPLTGRTARICHFMKLHWDKPDFEAMVAGTEKTCPFCADKVMKVTPCFPPEIIAEGRMTAAEAESRLLELWETVGAKSEDADSERDKKKEAERSEDRSSR